MASHVFVSDTREFYTKVKRPEMHDEVTLSHMLRENNGFTRSGLPYGAELAKVLASKRLLKPECSILEIGPGEGDLARNLTSGLSGEWKYTFMDLSPALLGALKKKFTGKQFDFVRSDVLSASAREKRFDAIICSEVLADLPAVVNMSTALAKEKNDKAISESLEMIKRYGLDVPKQGAPFNFNYGAIKFLERLEGLLTPGGFAFIAENMCDPGFPRPVKVYGHSEFNIRFSWLEKAASSLGFSSESGTVTELLGIKGRKRFLSMFLQPELKPIFDHMNRHNIGKDILAQGTLAMETEAFLSFLEQNAAQIGIEGLDDYRKLLPRAAREFSVVSDQFGYLILRKQKNGQKV
jgi:phospholipid N-methyltransferase